MIGLIYLVVAVQAVPAEPAEQDSAIISSLTLRLKEIDGGDLKVAQRYASCISMPYFPVADEFAAEREQCRANRKIAKASASLISTLDSVDAIVRNHPGSEASLTVIKDQ